MIITCNICGASCNYSDSVTLKEIENDGYMLWGNVTGDATCLSCLENPISSHILNRDTKPTTPSKKREITLIVSGFHLGATCCDVDQIKKILDSEFNQLIINGNLIDYIGWKSLSQDQLLIIRRLETLQEKKKLIIIEGYDDNVLASDNKAKALTDITSLKYVPSYTFEYFGKKIHLQSGHKLSNDPLMIEKAAIAFALQEGYNTIGCSYQRSVYAAEPILKRDATGVIYFNCGNFLSNKISWALLNGKTDNIALYNHINHKLPGDNSCIKGARSKHSYKLKNNHISTANNTPKPPIIEYKELPKNIREKQVHFIKFGLNNKQTPVLV